MSRASSSPKVEIVERGALAGIVPAWEGLAADASEPNPFYEPWLLLPALRAYGSDAIRCVTVWHGDRLDALFPLEAAGRYRGLPAGVMRSWRHRHMLLCTPLVRKGREGASVEALLGWVRRSASILELDYLNADGPFHAALRRVLNAQKRTWLAGSAYKRPLLQRAASAETYLAAASRNLMRDLKRRERRLAELGKVEHVELRPGGDIGQWIEDFLRIEAGGWKGKAGGAFACSETDRRFATEAFRGAFERGRLLAHGIDVGGKAVARELSFTGGDGAFAFKTAYDEAFSRGAPGVLLELDVIRSLHAHPTVQWMDSFTAEGNHKLEALWPGRRRIERIAAGVDAWGSFTLSLLPALRWARQAVKQVVAPERKGTSSPSSAALP